MNTKRNPEKRSWKVRKAIRGLVVPSATDDAGRVIECSIVTDEDEEYEVFGDEQGQELCEMADEEVIARGVIRFDLDGPDRIRVEWFRAVEWRDDAEDGEELFGDESYD